MRPLHLGWDWRAIFYVGVFGPLYGGVLLALGGASTVVLLGTIPFVLIGGGATLALARRAQEARDAQSS